jgi:hypothetical protein
VVARRSRLNSARAVKIRGPFVGRRITLAFFDTIPVLVVFAHKRFSKTWTGKISEKNGEGKKYIQNEKDN